MAEIAGLYCNVEAIGKTDRDRYKQTTEELTKVSRETNELPDGFAFQLKSEAGVALSPTLKSGFRRQRAAVVKVKGEGRS
jgi:hypothetical protein